MPFYIVSDGRVDCRGAKVIEPHTGEVLIFATRREARAHRDAILPDQPSKYLPLRVRELEPA